MRNITHIVLHCTATPQTATIESIQNYWRTQLGWKSPGYHYIITPNGSTIMLQPIDKVSNGVAGHNAHSINVSYIGGVNSKGQPVDNRTLEQKCVMSALVKQFKQRFPDAEILGHRDFPGVKKACPSFDARAWWKEVCGA